MNNSSPGPGEICEIPALKDRFGTIGVIEGERLLPFEVKRLYFIYDVATGAERGAHAHKALRQLIFSAHGSFTVVLDNGITTSEFVLEAPDKGLLVEPGNWRTLKDFSEDAVVMVLASLEYDESDYIRDYEEFVNWRNQ